MTTTTVETMTVTEPQLARIQYLEPDTSGDPWDCEYFALPKAKTITNHVHPLHDLRSSIFQTPSAYTLATHAFTAIKHKSILHTPPHSITDFYTSSALLEHYLPELEALVKTVTGCTTVFTLNVAVRTKEAPPIPKTVSELAANPPTEPELCGVKIDKEKFDLRKPMLPNINKSQNQGVGPVRSTHIDFSPPGARSMLRYKNPDIAEHGKDIIEAEDAALASGKRYEGRRYAIYSVWRPLKDVKRDPLILCDPNSIDEEKDLREVLNKQPGFKGDYLSGVFMLSGNDKEKQKWCWISEQREDEVYFLQFYDNFAERDGRPVGVPHGSPELIGVESDEIRESIECRVIAFW